MPAIIRHRLKSLPQFIEIVQQLQKDAGHALWFRGCTKGYGLLPSLYRHPTTKTVPDLRKLERELMTRFRQRSIPYHTRDLMDDWDALFFMQHYGVPTRLLDWTENPLVALHFALIHGRSLDSSASEDAVVWVIDPEAWNRAALEYVSYTGGPLSTIDEDLKGYSPAAPTLSTHPVALYGAHNSPRMVAQQGAFVIFGSGVIPMDQLVVDGTFPRPALTKILIAPSKARSISRSLLNQGLTETVVFPDLEGLAREIKRHFGFG